LRDQVIKGSFIIMKLRGREKAPWWRFFTAEKAGWWGQYGFTGTLLGTDATQRALSAWGYCCRTGSVLLLGPERARTRRVFLLRDVIGGNNKGEKINQVLGM
jgi:hypothetical protein